MALASRPARWLGAIVGGLGFGLLVDEVGKFLTSDNNYFFQPAPALIYAIIISVFLGARFVARNEPLAPREYLSSALEIAKKIAAGDFDERDRRRALAYLESAGESQTATDLRRLVEHAPITSSASPLDRWQDAATRRIVALRRRPGFYRWMAWTVLAGAIITGLEIIGILMLRHRGVGGRPADGADVAVHGHIALSVVSLLELIVALCSLGFAIAGVRGTADGHHGLRYSEVSLFIGVAFLQPFAFYEAQFFAFAGMVLGIGMIVFLDYADENPGPGATDVGSAPRSSRPTANARDGRRRARETVSQR